MVKIKTRPIRLLCLLFFLCGLQNGLQALTDTLDGKDENTPFPATLSSVFPLWFLEWSVVSRAVMQKSLQVPEGIK